MPGKVLAQLVHRPPDALLRRAGINAQRHPDFLERFLLEETQRQGVAILFAQPGHGFVQERGDLFPGGIVGGSGLHLHGLLFPPDAAVLADKEIGAGETGGAQQPGGKNDALAKGLRLPGQQHKNHLRDFLRQMRITDLAQGGGIDQADVAFGQRGEGRFRTPGAVCRQQIIALLSRRFGEPLPVPAGEEPVWSFPGSARLAEVSESDLRGCKLGFRAPYLRGTAQKLAAGEVDLGRLCGLSLDEARAELLKLPGVGVKIADCVLLFACGFPEAFPVDVWIMKALRRHYFPRRSVSPARLRRFIPTHFGPQAGYAQQYLFHYMRVIEKLQPVGRGSAEP